MEYPSIQTLERLVLFTLDSYETRTQSGVTPIEITWLLGQETSAVTEVEQILDTLVQRKLAGKKNGLYYCINLYGLDD